MPSPIRIKVDRLSYRFMVLSRGHAGKYVAVCKICPCANFETGVKLANIVGTTYC